MGSYYLTAMGIVLAIPIVGLVLASALARWARDAVSRAPAIGALGVLFTLGALANLFVARACGDGVSRPILAVALGDDACRRVGLVSVALAVLLVVATAVAVRLDDVRH